MVSFHSNLIAEPTDVTQLVWSEALLSYTSFTIPETRADADTADPTSRYT
jgi:hypothetical protein